MVKLRVVVRVIPEDDYLRNLERPASSLIPGEKRLIVIVREPHKWQIGTLALEVQRAYKSCYQHELPTIKYLKDNEDDCDLDPQLYVSDLLLDEGKAEREGTDQRATIKVILEQGRAVREGSVAVGNLLDAPQFRLQYQKTSRPPVPRFPGVSSSLGKRSVPPPDAYSDVNGHGNGVKKPRQIEIPETQRGESVVSSIERDVARRSPEFVQATQHEDVESEYGWQQQLEPQQQQQQQQQQSHIEPKVESPELWRSFQHIPSATVDELEELPEQPHTFAPRRRNTGEVRDLQRSSGSHQPNGVSLPAQVRHSQAPITPPTEVSTGRSTSTKLRSVNRDPANIPSASKFKRRDIYDFPESDIDDTQMSPRSRQAQLRSRKSTDRLSRIELLRSPDQDRIEDAHHELIINEALDILDNESVFNDNGVAPQDFVTPELPRRAIAPPAEESEDSIYEDAPTDGVQLEGVTEDSNLYRQPTPGIQTQKTPTPALQSDDEGGDKENQHAIPTSAQPVSKAPKPVAPSEPRAKTPVKAPAAPSPADQDQPSPAKKRVRRRMTAKSARASINGDDASGQLGDGAKHSAAADTPAKAAPKPAKKTDKHQRTPSHDSTGEQLSQALQESARKQDSANAKADAKKLVAAQKKAPPTPAAGKKRTKAAMEDTSGKTTDSTEQTAFAQQDEPAPTPKKPRQRKGKEKPTPAKKDGESAEANQDPPSIVVQRSEEEAPAKPLPNWGSSPIPAIAKERAPGQDRAKSLGVDQSVELRKSPSIPVGLTEEEIRIMKSREGMTKEQYEAEKKRKQQEAHRQAAEWKKKEAAAAAAVRRESAGNLVTDEKTSKPQTGKTSLPASAPASETKSTGNKARKSFSAEDAPKPKGVRKSLTAEDAPKPTPKPKPKPEPKPKAARKSTSAEDAVKPSTEPKDDAGSNQSQSGTSAKSASTSQPESSEAASSTGNSSKPLNSESGATAKTPDKTSTKSPSVKSTPATVSKQEKTDTTAAKKSATPAPSKKATPAPTKKPTATATATPAPATKPASVSKPASKSKPTPDSTSTSTVTKPAAPPTLTTAKKLTELHEVLRNATQALTSAATSASLSRASSRPGQQKRSVLDASTDDDDDESSDDESDDEEEQQPSANTKTTTNTNTNTVNTVRNADKTQNQNQNQNQNQKRTETTSSSGSSSDEDEDESEPDLKAKAAPESESKSTSTSNSKPVANTGGAGKGAAAAAGYNAKSPATTKLPPQHQSQPQGKGRGRISIGPPDPSIRDPSVESDDDDDDDDDEDDEL